MRAKETSFTSTLRDLEDVRLAKNKEADRAGARVWLIEHCALLTELELGVGPGGTETIPHSVSCSSARPMLSSDVDISSLSE